MIIGIHPDRAGEESYSTKWETALLARGVEVRHLDLLAADALEQARNCDGVMWRWLHNANDKQSARNILFVLEYHLGVPVYPDIATSWHFDEKGAQVYLFQALGAPTPQNWLFWRREDALNWAASAHYPVVFKLFSGAGSANVLLVESQSEATKLIERAFRRGFFPYTFNEYAGSRGPRARTLARRCIDAVRHVWCGDYPQLHPHYWKPEFGYAYFQEFVPGNEFDIRVTIIGDRAFGFRRFNRTNDFRASGSGSLDPEPGGVDPQCVRLAFELSRRGGFQSMAYDFLMRDGRPLVVEISYSFADWAVHRCPGHWNAQMQWIPGQMWPEEAQVDDFLLRASGSKRSPLVLCTSAS
jgi:glutathione synthase/RimK-type ligase-like ATP-grasp enzyme